MSSTQMFVVLSTIEYQTNRSRGTGDNTKLCFDFTSISLSGSNNTLTKSTVIHSYPESHFVDGDFKCIFLSMLSAELHSSLNKNNKVCMPTDNMG